MKILTERVPKKLVIGGGICFVVGFLLFPPISIIGFLIGLHILKKYPHKRMHGLIPLILNGLVFLTSVIVPILIYLIMQWQLGKL